MNIFLITFSAFTLTIIPKFIFTLPQENLLPISDVKCDKPVKQLHPLVKKEANNSHHLADSATNKQHKMHQDSSENHLKFRKHPKIISKKYLRIKDSINSKRERRNQNENTKKHFRITKSVTSNHSTSKSEAEKDMFAEILNLIQNINNNVATLKEQKALSQNVKVISTERTPTTEESLGDNDPPSSTTIDANEDVPSDEEDGTNDSINYSQEIIESDVSSENPSISKVTRETSSLTRNSTNHHSKNPMKENHWKKSNATKPLIAKKIPKINFMDILGNGINGNISSIINRSEPGYSYPYIARTLIVFAVLLIILVFIFIILVGRFYFPLSKGITGTEEKRCMKRHNCSGEHTDEDNDELNDTKFLSMIETASYNDDDLPPMKDHIHHIKRRIGEDEDFLTLDKFEGWRHKGHPCRYLNVPSFTRMMQQVDPCSRIANLAKSHESCESIASSRAGNKNNNSNSSGKQSLEDMVADAVDDASSIFEGDSASGTGRGRDRLSTLNLSRFR